MGDVTTTTAPRPPGRPRSARADEAIIDAVLDLLADGTTVEALSIEAVAAKAGVGKATIYRRWSHKDALVVDAIASLKGGIPVPGGESVRDDLVMLMRLAAEGGDDPRARRIMPCLLPELQRGGKLRDQYMELIDRRREVTRSVLRRGISAGELRSDLDIELTAAVLSSVVVMNMVGASPHLDSTGLAERVVDTVLRGILA